jgi:L-seryl-tRNA(Ser) seleniumtransferase
MTERSEAYRRIPSVDALATSLSDSGLSHPERIALAREVIDIARGRIGLGEQIDIVALANSLVDLSRLRRIGKVVNATGVLLHTNLGRAPISASAAEAARIAVSGYANAEFDLASGERGSRGAHTGELLRLLTGAEDALVVNNNAAAVLLAIAALATERSVPVSRSELVEIGGSYRLPEVMKAGGADLIEVGTTNKTRLGDYETALQTHTCGMVLKVHQANFEITGFTDSVPTGDLIALCQSRNVPFVFDIGSGLLDTQTPWMTTRPSWLKDEPGVKQALGAGADLVMFSGDKLLGGPQAGVIVGRRDLIGVLRNHPLRRALRVDAATDAALAATLESYAHNTVSTDIPFWRMATISTEVLTQRASTLASSIGGSVEVGWSLVGAGSAPGARIESPIVRLQGRQDMFKSLLTRTVPVVARRDRGDLLFDLRSVDPDDDHKVADEIRACL